MWTHFMDMHSGGFTKEPPYEHIYIEAPEDEARVIFYNRFDHNPNRVTCTCCGNDYSIDQSETLEQASAFQRGCDSGYILPDGTEVGDDHFYATPIEKRKELRHQYFERQATRWSFQYQPLAEYIERKDVLVIRADEIKPEERKGDIPAQGYVWL